MNPRKHWTRLQLVTTAAKYSGSSVRRLPALSSANGQLYRRSPFTLQALPLQNNIFYNKGFFKPLKIPKRTAPILKAAPIQVFAYWFCLHRGFERCRTYMEDEIAWSTREIHETGGRSQFPPRLLSYYGNNQVCVSFSIVAARERAW